MSTPPPNPAPTVCGTSARGLLECHERHCQRRRRPLALTHGDCLTCMPEGAQDMMASALALGLRLHAGICCHMSEGRTNWHTDRPCSSSLSPDSVSRPCPRSSLASASHLQHDIQIQQGIILTSSCTSIAAGVPALQQPPTLRMLSSVLRCLQPCKACLVVQSRRISKFVRIRATACFSWMSVVQTAGLGKAIPASPSPSCSTNPKCAHGMLVFRKSQQIPPSGVQAASR